MITTQGTKGKKKCVVVRPFKYEGKVLAKGKEVDLPAAFAFEMKAANKVVLASEVVEAIDPVKESGKSKKNDKKKGKDAGGSDQADENEDAGKEPEKK